MTFLGLAFHFVAKCSLPLACKINMYIHLFFLFASFYTENRAGPSNLGNVISQILLCKQITPDFNEEELCSITKDSQDIAMLLSEMQEYMPQHEAYLGKFLCTSHCAVATLAHVSCTLIFSQGLATERVFMYSHCSHTPSHTATDTERDREKEKEREHG